MLLILGPLREAYPQLTIELWEDVTASLLDRLRSQRLDAALIATEIPEVLRRDPDHHTGADEITAETRSE